MNAPGTRLRIATRRSPLAMWQAEHVAALLRAAHPGVDVELVGLSTEGDRRLDVPLSEIGGKGVFATEVQAALLDGRADLAVHSAKDLPAVTAPGLVLAAVPERGDARDALVGARLDDLPADAVVATGSARRRALLARARPDLRFQELRGNMATRLARVGDDDVDAIVVASIAFDRLGLTEHLSERLDPSAFVPQVAQAALAIECRSDAPGIVELVAALEHAPSRTAVDAERAFLAELGGDCSLPAGAHAALEDDGTLSLDVVLADEVGGHVVQLQRRGADGAELGRSAAVEARDQLGAPSSGPAGAGAADGRAGQQP